MEKDLEELENSGASSQEIKSKEDSVVRLQAQVFSLEHG
jgi:hypothetical protein